MYYNIEDQTDFSSVTQYSYIGETTAYGKKDRQKSGKNRR